MFVFGKREDFLSILSPSKNVFWEQNRSGDTLCTESFFRESPYTESTSSSFVSRRYSDLPGLQSDSAVQSTEYASVSSKNIVCAIISELISKIVGCFNVHIDTAVDQTELVKLESEAVSYTHLDVYKRQP